METMINKLLNEIKSNTEGGICLFDCIKRPFESLEEKLKTEPSEIAQKLIDKIYSNMRHGTSGKAYIETDIL